MLLTRGRNFRILDDARLQKNQKKRPEALLAAATEAFQRGEHDEARKFCRKILRDRLDIFDALHLLGFLQLDGPYVEEAEKRFFGARSSCIRIRPKRTPTWA